MELLILLFKEIFTLGAMTCVIVPLLLIIKKVFHRALSPKWHYYLWAVLLLRLLIPFQPPSNISIYNVFYNAAELTSLPVSSITQPQNTVTPPVTNGTDIIDIPGADNVAAPDTNHGSGTAYDDTPDQTDSGAATFIKTAALIWLTGMIALGSYTAVLNLAFASRVRKLYRPYNNARITAILTQCKKSLHIQRNIPLLTADMARAPCLYGFFKPKILICEASLLSLTDTEIKHIFLHELSHYRQKDIAVNGLMTLLQVIYFFNPLIWYAFFRIRQDSEMACDAAALSHLKPEEYRAYGGTVIKLMRLLSESSFVPVTAGIAKNKTSIKRRIHMISNFKKSKWTGAVLAIVLMTAVALSVMTGCATPTAETPEDNTPSPSSSVEPSQSPSMAPSETPDDNDGESAAPDTGSETSPSGDPATTVTPRPTPEPMPSAYPSPTAAPSATASASTYLGNWTVSDVQAYGSVGTYSKEDAEKLIGKTLSFTVEDAVIINDQPSDSPKTVKNPQYEEGTVTKEEFSSDFKMSFETLGIDADSLTTVNVSADDAGGCVLLIKDANTLILAAGGTYFLLARV